MSRHGHKLAHPDKDGIMVCPEAGLRYVQEEDGRLRCLDLAEDEPLPDPLCAGQKVYKEYKDQPTVR
jgi:UDP-2-acetamido-3-amino-2,3-dideoxy-glucuronate N-acetyltransferase